MRRFVGSLAAVSAALTLATPAPAAEYALDTGHSHVLFKVKHLAISTVTGQFNTFSGSFQFDPSTMVLASVTADIDAGSIDTNVPDRDKHLRSADFFDVEKHPRITFASTAPASIKNGKGQLQGNLTLHGVTKPVALDLEFTGSAKDPWGNDRVAFVATGKLNRKDYGLTWNKTLESGGLLVGEDIGLTIEVEAIAKKAEAASSN